MTEAHVARLLDANLLIALAVAGHVHHDRAEAWFAADAGPIATCPITQGALVRFFVREGLGADVAVNTLNAVTSDPRHEFWPDDVAYSDVDLGPVVGHRQVTDAYLTGLARAHAGRVVTFDAGLAAAHPDVVELLPA